MALGFSNRFNLEVNSSEWEAKTLLGVKEGFPKWVLGLEWQPKMIVQLRMVGVRMQIFSLFETAAVQLLFWPNIGFQSTDEKDLYILAQESVDLIPVLREIIFSFICAAR